MRGYPVVKRRRSKLAIFIGNTHGEKAPRSVIMAPRGEKTQTAFRSYSAIQMLRLSILLFIAILFLLVSKPHSLLHLTLWKWLPSKSVIRSIGHFALVGYRNRRQTRHDLPNLISPSPEKPVQV